MTVPKDVAIWMVERLEEMGSLYQEQAVLEIQAIFGDEFVYINPKGNPAIDRRVLREFRKLTEGVVVWGQGEKVWRKGYNPLGSRRAD